ncbi:zinc-ribbon domain-containing protein [Aporhodopirellula aestuarii]|uniref:Zinc-ribbon domain-containing protein n=1 Tax=Aporhodopirellula aestuarii TaxID=2950107 RepID=A0ABT0U783_9BACT|nr:zinc-ribbon domain-containing protein [Aporhodopirellula aestuarii]MCM2372278.1 zinc-ribbon domain-containing protein [Aporhodopirellula aestuarii]
MPVIQCPSCQKSLNVKQMPAGGRIKCPACGGVIPVGGAAGARPTAARPAASGQRKLLTPEDEGFDFGQIQFPAAGPVAVTQFPDNPYSRSAYHGPIPGDPLGEYIGGPADQPDEDGGKPRGKAKGKLSPLALAAILGGTLAFLLIAIVIGTVVASSGGDEEATPAAETDSGS